MTIYLVMDWMEPRKVFFVTTSQKEATAKREDADFRFIREMELQHTCPTRDLRLVTLDEYLEANDNMRDVIPELKAAIQKLEDVGRKT